MGLFGFDRNQQSSTPSSVEDTSGADTLDSSVFGGLSEADKRAVASRGSPLSSNNKNEDEEVELLYLVDNPYGLQPKDNATGHFGPLPMRTNYDKMFYGCGAAYIFGITGGGLIGLYRGIVGAQSSQFVILRNSILNQTTRYGPWAANSLGVLSLAWAAIDSTLANYRNGVSDNLNHVSAAFISGAIFKSTAGLRPAFLSGAVFASSVGFFCVARDLWNGKPLISSVPMQTAPSV